MCGIAGIISRTGDRIDQGQLDRLTDAVAHRGPDGRGTWVSADGVVGFGHRRLSILDTSVKGAQPMLYSSRYRITYNGEVYNFIELKDELVGRGYLFETESDTEVILAAYQEWGEECQHRFNGMWSFAIYDASDKSVFISRDRFGIKPLYYYSDSERFVFSSEVQAIDQFIGEKSSLNETVIKSVLTGASDYHGTVQTYLTNVFSLPGGYSVKLKNGNCQISEWYKLRKVAVPATLKDQASELRKFIQSSCKLRMRSDVPVATCLSGGVDSGAITAVLKDQIADSSGRFNNYSHTGFCAGFPGAVIDESTAARRLASQLTTDFKLKEIEAPSAERLVEAMRQCDGPMHALAFYPIWELYGFIRKNDIKVTLDGQGPDEMLGGYRPVLEAMQTAWERKKFRWFADVRKTYSSQGESAQFSSKEFVNKKFREFLKHHWKRKQIVTWPVKKSVPLATCDEGKQNTPLHLLPVRIPENFQYTLDKSLYAQFFCSPLPGILQQYDRCSMAHGVECRMPFMDYRIVEFIFSLPPESKVGNGYTKLVLREAMKDLLPDETRLNKLKIGFNAPIVDWFRGPLKTFMLDQMRTDEFRKNPYFDGTKIESSFVKFLGDPKAGWSEAWQFWPPVHLNWWMTEKKLNKSINASPTIAK